MNGDSNMHGKALNERLEKLEGGVDRYGKPRASSRKRQEVRWKGTYPRGVKRGVVPLFCHDLTTRVLRCLVSVESVKHPCGVEGVASLSAILLKDNVELATAYGAIISVEGTATPGVSTSIKVGKVYPNADLSDLNISIEEPRTELQEA